MIKYFKILYFTFYIFKIVNNKSVFIFMYEKIGKTYLFNFNLNYYINL